jgi:hypothetical protein
MTISYWRYIREREEGIERRKKWKEMKEKLDKGKKPSRTAITQL